MFKCQSGFWSSFTLIAEVKTVFQRLPFQGPLAKFWRARHACLSMCYRLYEVSMFSCCLDLLMLLLTNDNIMLCISNPLSLSLSFSHVSSLCHLLCFVLSCLFQRASRRSPVIHHCVPDRIWTTKQGRLRTEIDTNGTFNNYHISPITVVWTLITVLVITISMWSQKSFKCY